MIAALSSWMKQMLETTGARNHTKYSTVTPACSALHQPMPQTTYDIQYFIKSDTQVHCHRAVFYSKQEAEASGRMAAAEQLESRLQQLEQEAAAFSTPNEFGSILSQAGAVGLNATTSHDATRYFMAMPNNKLELWFALEAERFRVCLICC